MTNAKKVKNLPKRMIEIPGMRRTSHVHFVGIGGAGMCGIAEIVNNQGYTVSGSDIKQSATTERLQSLGVQVFIGHDSKISAKRTWLWCRQRLTIPTQRFSRH